MDTDFSVSHDHVTVGRHENHKCSGVSPSSTSDSGSTEYCMIFFFNKIKHTHTHEDSNNI